MLRLRFNFVYAKRILIKENDLLKRIVNREETSEKRKEKKRKREKEKKRKREKEKKRRQKNVHTD